MLEPGAVYHITNAKSGTALDLSGTDNVSLIGGASHDGDNQKWRLDQDRGLYTLRNVRTGRYVGLAGPSGDGVKVIALDFEFKWEIKPDEEDNTVYRFYVPGTPFNLELSGYGNPNGNTPIEIWGKWDGMNQCWRLQQL